MKYIYLLFFITIIINHPILSQEIVESEGKIENAQILIEKNKIILLPDAQKKGDVSIQKINKIIKYNLNFNPLDLSLNKEKLSIDQINDYLINKKIINNYNNNFSVLKHQYKSGLDLVFLHIFLQYLKIPLDVHQLQQNIFCR